MIDYKDSAQTSLAMDSAARNVEGAGCGGNIVPDVRVRIDRFNTSIIDFLNVYQLAIPSPSEITPSFPAHRPPPTPNTESCTL